MENPDEVFVANKFINMCPQNAIIDLPTPPNDASMVTDDPTFFAKAIRGAFQGNQKAKKMIREAKLNGIDYRSMKNQIPQIWGKEACLVINVNTPAIPADPDDESQLKPVILCKYISFVIYEFIIRCSSEIGTF